MSGGSARTEPTSIWDPRLVGITAGAIALIFLAALQSLAVTTVMPIVAAELDGQALFAVAFAGTLATSVIGMVVTGSWADRAGPKPPLYVAVGLFVLGLIIVGMAQDMPTVVAGRLVQGLGVGGQTVALYVVVARAFPAALHGRVFAAFSAAWVVPSIIGPALAGAVAELLHWRWVFLGVGVLALLAFLLVAWRLRGVDLHTDEPAPAERLAVRVGLAAVVAGAVLVLGLAGEAGGWTPVLALGAIAVLLVALRPLLPRRTYRAGRGLPSAVLMRGMIAGALFGAEVYIPYLLMERFGFSATLAGIALTAAAISWTVSAEVQGRYGDRIGNSRIALICCGLVALACASAAATAVGLLPPWGIVGGWLLAGLGMGLMYPRLTVLTLAYSTPQNQGFNSAALSISDSVGSAAAIAVMGLVFTALSAFDAGFPAVFLLAALLALVALVPGLRLGRRDVIPETGPIATIPAH